MGSRMFTAMLASLACACCLFLPDQSAVAVAQSRPTLRAPSIGQVTVDFFGRANPLSVIRLQYRRRTSWATLTRGRASRRGRYEISLRAGARPGRYRVVSRGGVSRTRRITSKALRGTGTPIPDDGCGPRLRRADGSLWDCAFRDDFEGRDLDRSKWLVQQTAISGMYGGSDGCYVDNSRTVSVADGALHLTSTVLDDTFTCHSPFGDFPTNAEVATVATRSRFTQTYGRFEARMRFPAENNIAGSHSAFWLYPQEHTYGRWPASGEIDVAEWYSALPSNVFPSVHYAGEDKTRSSGYDCLMPTASTAFHDYAVEWSPTIMRFYYDGHMCFSHSWSPIGMTTPQPFDQPFYIVLTQVWGLGWNSRTEQSSDTSTLVVDWVKAWA
jgi:hypothetical protein